ncbi:MAG: NAD(P)-binding protein, partial [bacterium]
MTRALRVAVVGSGPSGMYAADALTSQEVISVSVDIIDRLPSPFGLVRYGVATDHLSLRSVRDTLDKVLDKPGVRFAARRTVSPTDDGRVMDGDAVVPGIYVAGWIKRGPTVIIGTNKKYAVQTVGCLLEDAADPGFWT